MSVSYFRAELTVVLTLFSTNSYAFMKGRVCGANTGLSFIFALGRSDIGKGGTQAPPPGQEGTQERFARQEEEKKKETDKCLFFIIFFIYVGSREYRYLW